MAGRENKVFFIFSLPKNGENKKLFYFLSPKTSAQAVETDRWICIIADGYLQ